MTHATPLHIIAAIAKGTSTAWQVKNPGFPKKYKHKPQAPTRNTTLFAVPFAKNIIAKGIKNIAVINIMPNESPDISGQAK